MKTTPRARRWIAAVLFASLTLGLTGCMGIWNNRQHHAASSVVQFLYPDKDRPYIEPQIPTLRLPLRVGVAFLPSATVHDAGDFGEAQKTEILERVAGQFRALPFVQKIEIIPTTYLRPGGSFDNLDQLRSLMGLDVVVLLAYDQVQTTAETEAALAYWTIVGAYLVPAQRNSTSTLMEAVVYDIPSRSLLFRAPGVSTIENHATLIRTEQYLREDSLLSLRKASDQLTTNLALEIDRFKIRLKEEPQSVHIENKPGYIGGGALDVAFAAVLLLALALSGFVSRRS